VGGQRKLTTDRVAFWGSQTLRVKVSGQSFRFEAIDRFSARLLFSNVKHCIGDSSLSLFIIIIIIIIIIVL